MLKCIYLFVLTAANKVEALGTESCRLKNGGDKYVLNVHTASWVCVCWQRHCVGTHEDGWKSSYFSALTSRLTHHWRHKKQQQQETNKNIMWRGGTFSRKEFRRVIKVLPEPKRIRLPLSLTCAHTDNSNHVRLCQPVVPNPLTCTPTPLPIIPPLSCLCQVPTSSSQSPPSTSLSLEAVRALHCDVLPSSPLPSTHPDSSWGWTSLKDRLFRCFSPSYSSYPQLSWLA